MLLPDLLDRSADAAGDKEAAVFPSEKTTFAALERAANQVARRLLSLGIGPKKRVALLYENSLAGLTYFWGALKAGAETVDIPTLLGTRAINTILEECKPAALAIDPKQALRLKEAGVSIPQIILGTRETGEHINDRAFFAL